LFFHPILLHWVSCKVVKNVFLIRHGKCKINSDRKITRKFFFHIEFKHLKIHGSNKNSYIVQIP
jgi:hypothetical protein